VVTWVCVSPHSACLIPLRLGSEPPWLAVPRRERRGAWARAAQSSGFVAGSVGFGNELAVSAAESATLTRERVWHGDRPGGQPTPRERDGGSSCAGAGHGSSVAGRASPAGLAEATPQWPERRDPAPAPPGADVRRAAPLRGPPLAAALDALLTERAVFWSYLTTSLRLGLLLAVRLSESPGMLARK